MDKTVKDYVNMSVSSGLAPIELEYRIIDNMVSKDAYAYRATLRINSIIFGTLDDKDINDFNYASNVKVRLFENGLKKVIQTLKMFEDEMAQINFISFKCSYKVLTSIDVYEIVKKEFERHEIKHPERLVLEFDSDIFKHDYDKLSELLGDLRLLKVRIMVTGVGNNECPTHMMSQLPINIVILDSIVTTQALTESKESIAQTFIQYLMSMGLDIIISDIKEDLELDKLKNWSIVGFIPSVLYVGSAVHHSKAVPIQEIL